MDIIDKIFSKLNKEQAPGSLRAKILDIPEEQAPKPAHWAWLKLAVPVLLIVVLIGGFYYQYQSLPKIAAAFELTAENTDAAGISPESVFILVSSKAINPAQIKKIVKISPDVGFDVKSLENNRFQIVPLLKLAGNTIYQITIAEGAAERDYSWAFQVRAPFAAVSTFPRHQATGVPTNSSIEITFNRENILSPEKYFEISPKVDGKFEFHGENVVFLPKGLTPATVYTVKFKQGLSAKDLNEELGQDIVFAFETAPVSYSSSGYFSFGQEISYFPPNKKPAVSFYEYNTDYSQAETSVYSFSSESDFVKGYYNSRNWDLGWAYYYKQSGDFYDTAKLSKITSFKPQIIKSDYQTFFELPEILPIGYYLIDMKLGNLHQQAWVLINDISHYYSITDSNGFVWAYNFSQKTALENAQVAYFDINGDRHELAKTDKQGIAQFAVPDGLKNTPVNARDYGKPKLLEITPNNGKPSLALVSAGWWYNSSAGTEDNFWKYISTDRFTYQPSDTIKFWGVIKGKSRDYRDQKVSVQLRQGYYYGPYVLPGFENTDKPLAETQVLISSFDTISGELSYKGLQPGSYQIAVMVNDKIISQSQVEVLAYVKPAYKITVTPSRKAVFAGEPVDFNVKASFYDGTPYGALKLNYTGYNGSLNISGQVQLSRRGEGKITVTPSYSSQNYYYPNSLNLSFTPAQAEEADINSANSEINSSVLVFGPHLYLQSNQKYLENNNFSITAKVNEIVLSEILDARSGYVQYPEYVGNPKNGVNLSAQVEKTEYMQTEDGTYYDPINKTSNPKYRYESKKSIVGNYSGITSQNGEWVFNVNLPKADRVYYTVTISGTDSAGRNLQSIVYPYYYKNYESYYNSGASSGNNRIVLGLEFTDGKDQYSQQFSIGQKVSLSANILGNQQSLNGQTLFYRYGHNGIGSVQLMQGNSWEETFARDFRPGVSYKAVVFGPYGFVESNSLLAGYKQEDAKLKINIQPDKQNYRPGDTAKINIEVKDKDGKADVGEINLSVVDEAVFDILPYYWQQDILESLYQIDYTDPNSQASDFTPAMFQQNGGAEGGGCFLAGTPILLPGGKTKSIEQIKVGDVVQTRAEENDAKASVPAIVQGISSHLVDDYLVINNSLKVTQEHKLFVNNKWLVAGLIKIGDLLQDQNGNKIAVTAVKKVLAPKTMVYNFNVGAYHTYFAGGIYAHNAEKGGGYRSEFLDTAYFDSKPLIDGKANFEFKLPDNITSWRATASAFETGQIFAGQNTQLLPASLPFFTDTVISQTYLAGDQPTVLARAFGTSLNQNDSIIFTLDIDALNYHKTQTVNSTTANFVLPSLEKGSFELKLKAKQGNLEDGIIRKFRVADSYFETKQAKSISVTSGLKGLPISPTGITTVSFTDAGKAQFYSELVWESYQNGSRSDQLSASFVAGKMLQQYFGNTESVKNLDLSPYYVPEGGLGLFSYGDSDLAVSAMLSDLMPDQVYQTQLIGYFKNVMRDEKADIHRIAQSLYGLAALHQPVLAKLQLIKDEPDLTPEDKMYISLGLARLGDKETARKIYNNSIRPNLNFEAGQAWLKNEQNQTKQVKLTGLSGVVAASIGQSVDALSVWKYLQEHYPSEDLDVLERLMIVRDEITRANKTETSFTYEINGKKTDIKLEKGQSKFVTLTQDEAGNISFSNVKGQLTALAVVEDYKNPDALTKNSGLSIKRSYWVNGKQASQAMEGDVVTVRLEYSIAKQEIAGAYQVVDYLPSGLKAISNIWQRGLAYNYSNCSEKGQPLSIDGNKVYFSAYQGSVCPIHTLEYYARAATKGDFNANPPLIQSLKNYESLNIGTAQKLKITSVGN